LGQGFETVIAQICAGTLGVDYTRVRVVHGQTERIDHGVGAHATRATVMTGSATHIAALKVRARALEVASELLQTPAEALTIADGRVIRRDAPAGPSLELGEIARKLRTDVKVAASSIHAARVSNSRRRHDPADAANLPSPLGEGPGVGVAGTARSRDPNHPPPRPSPQGERETLSGAALKLALSAALAADGEPSAAPGGAGGLAAEGWFHTKHMTYPYGVHIAVVALDRDTGAVKIERYLIAYDVGRAVNPMLVEGQLVGGFAQGFGGALFEEFIYDERGEPLATTFADYLMPTAREVPFVDTLITEDAPAPGNPLGLKGAGEGGVNAVGAALASAIDDALGRPGAVTRLPVTPRRVRELLRATH